MKVLQVKVLIAHLMVIWIHPPADISAKFLLHNSHYEFSITNMTRAQLRQENQNVYLLKKTFNKTKL